MENMDKDKLVELREKIFQQGSEYASKEWNVHESPNEHDRAHDDFIAGALWVVKNHGVSHHVSESKTFDIHNCINEILQDADRYRYSAMKFVNDGRMRYQVKRAIDKMLYSR